MENDSWQSKEIHASVCVPLAAIPAINNHSLMTFSRFMERHRRHF
jgi:hypothetical protein